MNILVERGISFGDGGLQKLRVTITYGAGSITTVQVSHPSEFSREWMWGRTIKSFRSAEPGTIITEVNHLAAMNNSRAGRIYLPGFTPEDYKI